MSCLFHFADSLCLYCPKLFCVMYKPCHAAIHFSQMIFAWMGGPSTQIHRCWWDCPGNLPLKKKKNKQENLHGLLFLPFLFYFELYLSDNLLGRMFSKTSLETQPWFIHSTTTIHAFTDYFQGVQWICDVRFSPYRCSRLYYKFPVSVSLRQHYTSIGVWTFSNFLFQNWVNIYLLRGGLSSFSSYFATLGKHHRVLLIHNYLFYYSVLNISLLHLSCSYLLSSRKPMQWECSRVLLCGYQSHLAFLFLETPLALLIPWLPRASLRFDYIF